MYWFEPKRSLKTDFSNCSVILMLLDFTKRKFINPSLKPDKDQTDPNMKKSKQSWFPADEKAHWKLRALQGGSIEWCDEKLKKNQNDFWLLGAIKQTWFKRWSSPFEWESVFTIYWEEAYNWMFFYAKKFLIGSFFLSFAGMSESGEEKVPHIASTHLAAVQD